MKRIGTHLFCFSLLIATSFGSTETGSVNKTLVDGGHPIILDVNPQPAEAGEQATFTVTLGTAPINNQVYNISTTNSNAFDYLPSTVTVLQGQTTANFVADIADNASGSVTVTVTRMGTSKGVTFSIQ